MNRAQRSLPSEREETSPSLSYSPATLRPANSLRQLRKLTRIGLLAALIYVLALATTYLANIKLTFFIAFTSGYVWGLSTGMAVGGLGTALWSFFNPYGPAHLPLLLSQVLGMATVGAIGAVGRRINLRQINRIPFFIVAGLLSTIAYYLPVNIVDAWINQPFWPWFITGLLWTAISAGANVIIFPALSKITLELHERENSSA